MYTNSGYPRNLTPSQRAAFNRADYQVQQDRARAAAKAENDKREREHLALEKQADEALDRLVNGSEVKTFDDMAYLVNLYMNKGDEEGPEQFLKHVDNLNKIALDAAIRKLRAEHFKETKAVEDKFFKFVQMRDKRDVKKQVESFKGTGFEAIAKAIYDASPKRPAKEKAEEKVEE